MLDLCGFGLEPMLGSRVHSNNPSGSTKLSSSLQVDVLLDSRELI